MKILIAYDGSESANGVFEELKNAGLPKSCEALVMSVADVIIPPALENENGEELPRYITDGIKRAHQHAEQMLKEAETRAADAAERLKSLFPDWQVRPLALADSPAWAILREADEWNADLIVMGARGHSVLGGRLILGSISQRVVYETSCSVRIARKRASEQNALRLIIGVDNSPFSTAAVEGVARREWPNGTQVQLVNVVDTVMALAPDGVEPVLQKWIEVDDEKNWDEVAKLFEPDANKLRAAGLNVETRIIRGDPTEQLVEAAASWNADCIFLGPKGARGIQRLLLGSVSSAVAARAHCSVEIVRQAPNQ